MKHWILNTFFAKEKQAILETATRLGSMDAFEKAHADIRETMADDLDKKAEELSKKKLNDLLSIVDMQSIVAIDKPRGLIFIGGERADDARLINLKSEAEYLLHTNLWKLIQETPKELAQRAMFVAGESIIDLQKGRSMLYTLASQKNIVETLSNYVPKQDKPLAPQKAGVV